MNEAGQVVRGRETRAQLEARVGHIDRTELGRSDPARSD
jgi:hypothetical protein